MQRAEAIVIADWVKSLNLAEGAVCLNIGSSTHDFRTRSQPHIDQYLIAPLVQAGIRVVHCDMKEAEGVDEVGDVLDPQFRDSLKRYEADLLICSNLLEHLTDPKAFAEACGELVRAGGYGLFTVPLSYPYHPDPIDTLLRLRPSELAALMPDWNVVKAEQIKSGSWIGDLRKSGNGVKNFAKHVGRVMMPFYRPSHWKPMAHRMLWLFRPFRQTLVLLQKPAFPTSA